MNVYQKIPRASNLHCSSSVKPINRLSNQTAAVEANKCNSASDANADAPGTSADVMAPAVNICNINANVN
jgi:hypothetical protein